MARPLSPHGQVLDETLADGAWHDWDEVVDAMAAVIPPSRAFRHAERLRAANQRRVYGDARPRAIGDDAVAARVGAHDIAVRLIRARRVRGRIEERTDGGRRQVRKTPR